MQRDDETQPASLLPFVLLQFWAGTTTTWWWLAFARLESAPEWLRRAQAVCFGTSPSGLPDTYGWMTLVLAPLSIVLGLRVIYDDEIPGSVRRALGTSVGAAVSIAMAAAMWLQAGQTVTRILDARAATAAARLIPAALDEMPVSYPRLARAAPAFALTDQHGDDVTLARLAGAPFVVAFTFAHCQTICPTLVRQVRDASSSFPAGTPVLYVTLDPWRDTPSSLPTIAARWELRGEERVLSGAVPAVNRVLDGFDVPRGRDERTGDVTHRALAYVVDGEGSIAYALEGAALSWLGEAVRRAAQGGRP